ncbi:MAG: sigma-54 dependent transcriptional regulator [Gammaproteobacteria bacterium]|jgi:DNA-binding NtrC family response regulator|nr:sigma-54 dependent transcriptional regulator [Gammaproteobacteria bacterium]
MKTVLLVDDDAEFCAGLAELLQLQGHDTVVAHSLSDAKSVVAERSFDLVLLDLMLPDGSGLELLGALQADTGGHVALMTGHDAIKSYVSSMAGDGVSYLTKPIESKAVLALLDALDEGHETAGEKHFGLLVGSSPPMLKMCDQISKVAKSDTTVFLHGESGTGKELVAAAIHRESGRRGEFIAINCGGLTAELVSTELFGHEKGSFTGAARQHAGCFERAAEGTLFLDEITEMPADMQTQLLRVLESGRFVRVGGEREIESTARLIAATNRDPAEAVKDGKLREDLYFRLQVFPIELPPLRQRSEDIEELGHYFLAEMNRRQGTAKAFGPGFFAALNGHLWPGNVRELKHLVQRAFIMSNSDELEPPDSLEDPLHAPSGLEVGQSIRDVEKELILSTLEHYDGDKNAAAATLGVSLKTLYNRLKEYGDDV